MTSQKAEGNVNEENVFQRVFRLQEQKENGAILLFYVKIVLQLP